MLVCGAVGSYAFFKHLVSSLIFQQSLYTWGRCEMLLALPPPIYIVGIVIKIISCLLCNFLASSLQHLTCSNDIGYLIYRSLSVLFQILFEHRFIAKVPREQFLPVQQEMNLKQASKLFKIKSINPEYLYLVKFVPRRNLPELCPIQDLPALWFFIKQNFISRRNRIIPNLE